ncbi:hypothetical protein BsWGS_20131 [Bradybaena similaris]
MTNKFDSPSLKRPRSSERKIRHGGFGVTKSHAVSDVSMTPGRLDHLVAKGNKAAAKRRRSLNDANTTQVFEVHQDDDFETSYDDTPCTLSQISAIDPAEAAATKTGVKKKKNKSVRADTTLELAVQCARGKPDGADRSFARREFDKISLVDSQSEDVYDDAMEGVEEDNAKNDEIEALSPAKKQKMAKGGKAENKKVHKASLKIPLKHAAKKLKTLKSAGETKKAQKKINKNFEALPDETTVPKTPNQTWKEKKQQRKMVKNNFDLITSAKKAWEELRRNDLAEDKRKKICDNLMMMVVGKVKELAVVHDSSRIVQCLVQYGNDSIREIIFDEVKADLCDLCKLKYAKYVIRKLIHYGSKELKNEIFKCFHGHIRKLIRHKEASDIIEYAFNEFATAPQRVAILEEFYGPAFALCKDGGAHRSLDQMITAQPEKKEVFIRSMRDALVPLINKEILNYSLVHKAFFDFFHVADDKFKKEMIESLREHIPNLLHTRDGTRVAMNCVWSGSVKDRKIMVKSMKSHVLKVCKEEHGHFFLLSIFDSVDDTVLVQKVILDEMLKSLNEVVQDQYGRKVLLYLLCPRDSHHFHPDVVKILHEGDSNPTSKKVRDVRAKELRTHVSPALIKYLEDNTSAMLSDSHTALLLKEIITHAIGDVVPAMKTMAKLVVQPCTTTDGAVNMVEDAACHIALKKIIANDRTRVAAGQGVLFSSILLEDLPKSTIKIWATSNRGCFIILSLLEVGCPAITEQVKRHLQPVYKSLDKMKFKGAELLLKRLNATDDK